ncbi:MAG: response regulator [Lachnospiraceae bacterium]|nr:response regulator [Lachnospiraceae bacterium]
MKKTKTGNIQKMKVDEIFRRLSPTQKLLYTLWPIVLIVLLTFNLVTLISLGDYRMAQTSHDMTLHMQLEFRNYLMPVETLINGLATNLDQMIDDGADYEEFEDYLVTQTDLMTGEFAKDSTGLYGYINGRYVDGAHWIPPEDYVPEERDWYIETIAKGGRVAYVAPYIDAQSGDSSISVSRMLKDGKSVVALDLKVTSLQGIVDKLMDTVSDDDNDPNATKYKKSSLGQALAKYIMILDKDGKVVVHSDRTYGGLSINEIGDEPFKSIGRNVFERNEYLFTIKYNGNKDSFTVVELNSDWYAIAAVDYYDTFGGVLNNIVFTVIISLVVIFLLTYALFKAAANAMRAEDDRKNTGALAGIYSAVYKIYPHLDFYERLLGTSQKVNSVVPQKGPNAQKFFFDSLKITTNGENMDKLREFVDMSTLDVRLKDTSSITMEYINTQNKWCRERFVVAERDENGQLVAVLWVVEEIDAEKRSREELAKYSREMEQAWEDAEEARYEAEKANQAKSHFLANMSHEIRTPINAVLGLDTMILRESREEQIRRYALNIQTAGQSLLSIINDILDLSKIESGKMEIVPVEYDVASLINDVSNMIIPKVEAKELIFDLNIDSSIPCRLFGDDVRIRQILINLLTNAVKYTPEGTVTLTITGERAEDDAVLTCSVKDTGIGIAQEDLDKLFQEFVRIEEKRNRNIEGTGLGINIVLSLLSLMDSRLEVASEYGKGSEFKFTIKQKIMNAEPIGDLEKRIRERAVEYEHETGFTIPDAEILVVDDNEMNRYVFSSLLKDLECRIDEADSGMKCLELVKERKYDIIFMDHMMPEMDGVETFHRLREMTDSPNIDTPVIVLTANAITGAREQYLAEGFDDFLTKPVVPEKLEKLISDIIPKERQKPGRAKPAGEAGGTGETADELPVVEGVDWDYALLKLKKVELLKNVVSDFRLTAPSEIKALKGMFEKILSNGGDDAYNDYRIRVHAMKNTAAMCGGMQASALARTLEYAARDIDKDTLVSVMPVFEREWTQLKERFDMAFSEAEAGNGETGGSADGAVQEEKPAIDRDLFIQYLDNLNSAMEDIDTDTADAVMEELAQYGFEGEEKELLGELAVAVKNLDVDGAAGIIGRLTGRD